jgi:flagellar assembly protein FliH
MPLIKSANVPKSAVPYSMASIENQAKSLLSRARQQAEDLLAAAQAECDTLRTSAKAQGFTEGKLQGVEEGKKLGHGQALNEHREKLGSAIKAMIKVAEEFERSRGDLESGGLRSAIELAAAIATRVTKRQASIDPQVLFANLQGAIKLVSHWTDARIAVHPSQLQTLRAELPNLGQTWPQLTHVELVEDASLSQGSCRILTGAGGVDAELGTQLDQVIEQLLPTVSVSNPPATNAANPAAPNKPAPNKPSPSHGE